MKLSEIKIDPKKFEQGDWVGEIPEMGELRLKVRGIGNSDFRRMQSKLTEAEPRKYRVAGRLPPERQDAITAQCLLHTVLIDWDGVQGEDGQPLPYSEELARDLLTKPEFKRFREAVAWAANVVAEDIQEGVDDAGKNSKTRSSGS